ncbi:MAG TPA: FHA domain-containing protein [Ktedonobacteraceae bacterium]|jgi:pSer/pThr/pTyr-binding forkhead associated (FHA) protein|nr:FHA domain-containing protein [Ktedonobacteraceae bacterium]
MTLDVFLLILRLLFIVLLYLFLMQVVIVITRDLRRAEKKGEMIGKPAPVAGHLIVIDSGPSNLSPGTTFALHPQTTIGRGPTNTVVLPYNFISSEHARMWQYNNVWYIEDAGSTNGTYLNNAPAREALPAKAGDVVQIGFIRFKLAP